MQNREGHTSHWAMLLVVVAVVWSTVPPIDKYYCENITALLLGVLTSLFSVITYLTISNYYIIGRLALKLTSCDFLCL